MKIFTRIVIIADEGKMLTNGERYARSIELGDWDSADNYHEITEEEYNEIMAAEEAVPGEEEGTEECVNGD